MHRPPTQAELKHEQQRQRERLSQPPSVITVAATLLSVILTLYAVFGATATLFVVAVVCSTVIYVRAERNSQADS